MQHASGCADELSVLRFVLHHKLDETYLSMLTMAIEWCFVLIDGDGGGDGGQCFSFPFMSNIFASVNSSILYICLKSSFYWRFYFDESFRFETDRNQDVSIEINAQSSPLIDYD